MLNTSPSYGILHGDEFLEEFTYRYAPHVRGGQHVLLLGPSGRGKTTVAGHLLERNAHKFGGGITIQNGPDPALTHLGKATKDWPPTIPLALLQYDEKPLIRRFQPLITKPEHFPAVRRRTARILYWMFGKQGWFIMLPDLQLVSDPGMMGLGKEVDQLIITLRKRFSAVWMDAQAPRWIPRSSSDCTSHILMWRNRDEATVKRLKEIAGLDLAFILYLFRSLEWHDFLWIDNTTDDYFVVKSDPNWRRMAHGRQGR